MENAFFEIEIIIEYSIQNISESIRTTSLLKFRGRSGANVCKACRSRQDLSHECLLAKIGADTAENEQNFAEILPTDAGRGRHQRRAARAAPASPWAGWFAAPAT